jgi:hypothetical protein
MNVLELEKRFSKEVFDHMMDIMYSTPISDLVDMAIEGMSDAEINEWAESIKEDIYDEIADDETDEEDPVHPSFDPVFKNER